MKSVIKLCVGCYYNGIQKLLRDTDTAEFLESKLVELGLTEHEANEFIVFWLPQMEVNKYNLISFNNSEYIEDTKINIVPKADTAIRVFMAWKSCDKYTDIESPVISTPERNGFTIVEWGGSCLD